MSSPLDIRTGGHVCTLLHAASDVTKSDIPKPVAMENTHKVMMSLPVMSLAVTSLPACKKACQNDHLYGYLRDYSEHELFSQHEGHFDQRTLGCMPDI